MRKNEDMHTLGTPALVAVNLHLPRPVVHDHQAFLRHAYLRDDLMVLIESCIDIYDRVACLWVDDGESAEGASPRVSALASSKGKQP